MNPSSQPSSKKQTILGIILLVILLSAAVWVLWWFLKDLSKELFVTLATAVLTVVGALVVSRNTKLKDRELQIQAQQAEKREAIVGNFMKNFWLLVQGDFKNDKARDAHTQKTISDIMINGSMWLSDEALKEFVSFRLGSQNGDNVANTSRHIARLMLAFRKDLGHRNKGLSEKDMLDIFINDTEKIFEAETANDKK